MFDSLVRQTHAGKHTTVCGFRTHMDWNVCTDSGRNTWDTEKNTTVSKICAVEKSPFCRMWWITGKYILGNCNWCDCRFSLSRNPLWWNYLLVVLFLALSWMEYWWKKSPQVVSLIVWFVSGKKTWQSSSCQSCDVILLDFKPWLWTLLLTLHLDSEMLLLISVSLFAKFLWNHVSLIHLLTTHSLLQATY